MITDLNCVLTTRLSSWLNEYISSSGLDDPIPELTFAYMEGDEKPRLTILGLFERDRLPLGEGRGMVQIGDVEFFYKHPDIPNQLEGKSIDIENGKIVVY